MTYLHRVILVERGETRQQPQGPQQMVEDTTGILTMIHLGFSSRTEAVMFF